MEGAASKRACVKATSKDNHHGSFVHGASVSEGGLQRAVQEGGSQAHILVVQEGVEPAAEAGRRVGALWEGGGRTQADLLRWPSTRGSAGSRSCPLGARQGRDDRLHEGPAQHVSPLSTQPSTPTWVRSTGQRGRDL
eukprot:CAMPEP_0185176958 /NCGR_PEP_ID=MMETSP1139-20130426/29047_1 /TAXON_ID=298111 /ORGANISM="Pavlova sp., Strain CCMP459" /LENGTH=136 /DNA_ID=CAMNT_0027742735 /DNA_START=229 /DNA_END=635 /DNA_ORIENTATION=+